MPPLACLGNWFESIAAPILRSPAARKYTNRRIEASSIAGNQGFFPHGVDIDSNSIVWTSLAGSGDLASFDRRKCAVRSGPTATGQQCPEGWTVYHLPGPLLKGTDVGSADYPYYNWVDRFDTFGLGKNIPMATGTNSDSLLVLQPDTAKWVVLRVPYPAGFLFARTRRAHRRPEAPDGKAGACGRIFPRFRSGTLREASQRCRSSCTFSSARIPWRISSPQTAAACGSTDVRGALLNR